MKDRQQLELQFAEARKAMTPEQLLDHVIKLYGDEFDKANVEIARARAENDELFKLKQKVVIINRELRLKFDEAENRITELHKENEKLRAALLQKYQE
jgi:hypothetical protein